MTRSLCFRTRVQRKTKRSYANVIIITFCERLIMWKTVKTCLSSGMSRPHQRDGGRAGRTGVGAAAAAARQAGQGWLRRRRRAAYRPLMRVGPCRRLRPRPAVTNTLSRTGHGPAARRAAAASGTPPHRGPALDPAGQSHLRDPPDTEPHPGGDPTGQRAGTGPTGTAVPPPDTELADRAE